MCWIVLLSLHRLGHGQVVVWPRGSCGAMGVPLACKARLQ